MKKVNAGKVIGLGVLAVAGIALCAIAACDSSSGGSTAASSSSSSSGTTTGTSSSGTTTGTSSSGTTTGTSSSGTTTSSGTCASAIVDSTGFVTVGTQWMGYGFTADDQGGATPDKTCTSPQTTITPTCAATGCTPAFSGSMSGTIAACTDYAGFALVGWNVNQPKATSATAPPAGTWAIPATGSVTVTFSNPDNDDVRMQLQDSTGAKQWCVDAIVSGTPIPWTSFETECWTGGTPVAITAGTMIAQAAVQVPGTNNAATPYNICVSNITIQ